MYGIYIALGLGFVAAFDFTLYAPFNGINLIQHSRQHTNIYIIIKSTLPCQSYLYGQVAQLMVLLFNEGFIQEFYLRGRGITELS